MPFTLTMPKLSPTMEEGTIVKWRVKEGDFVKVGDVLLEVATDKATVEHSALDQGFIRKILISEGQTAKVNDPIAIFTEKKEESIAEFQAQLEKKPEVKAAPTKEAAIPKDAKAAPVSAEAKAMQQPAFTPEPPLEHYEFEFPEEVPEHIPASPLAKKLAKEKGIDLATIKGTGPSGRVVSRDLEMGQPAAKVTFGRHGVPKIAPGTFEEEPLSQMRKAIGKRLQESKTFVPHFYVSQEIDAAALVAIREQLKEGGLKLTFNDFVVRASALALRDHPEINSGFNTVNSSIIRFKTIDISIAVNIEAGLITPIVRHADYKNLGQISSEVKMLANKAKQGKLKREEYTGGSFTISNLGMFGISEFIAVINPPQAAILAIGGIQEKPVVKQGQVVPGKTMMLTLSVDHRVIDGTDAAKFLKTLQKYLENPALLIV